MFDIIYIYICYNVCGLKYTNNLFIINILYAFAFKEVILCLKKIK